MKKIIDFKKKNIQYAVYDYAYTNDDFLKNYNIEEINIQHFTNKIIITFNLEFLTPAIGILLNKLDHVYENTPEPLSIWIIVDATKVELKKTSVERILECCILAKHPIITFEIESQNYDLLQEKNIICYYNTNELYEDELLEIILKKAI